VRHSAVGQSESISFSFHLKCCQHLTPRPDFSISVCPPRPKARRCLHVLFYGTFNASLSKPRRALISINISGCGMDLECVCKWVSGMKVLPQPQSIRAENKDVWDGNKVDSNVRYQHF